MGNAESFHRGDCSRPVVVTFRAEALCLDHFCARCYEFLDSIERCPHSPTPASAVENVLMADECARRALGICMSETVLNNLERARLLDILLWCGDVSCSYAPRKVRAQFDAPYQKPASRRPKSSRVVPF